MFLDETSFWIGEFSKVDCLYPCVWASSNLLGPELKKKMWRARTSHLIFSFLWTGIYTTGSPVPQAFGLRLNYTELLGFPASKWQIVGLHGVHNYASQFPVSGCVSRGMQIKIEFNKGDGQCYLWGVRTSLKFRNHIS